MAVDHYENFPVASLLCPAALRPAVVAIYRYARTADDLADEGDQPPAQRLEDLNAYEEDLRRVAEQRPHSGRWSNVFGALSLTLARHRLPVTLLSDLLSAFRQDVVQHEYADRAALLDYCRRSANPVGRLLLHLYGVHEESALRASDAVCTSLQLINFYQDLGSDLRRGRLYLPLEDCRQHQVLSAELLTGQDSHRVRALVATQVEWARSLMHQGVGLPAQVRRLVDPSLGRLAGWRLDWELRLVMQGGLRILEKIEGHGHDALQHRPTLGSVDWLTLWWRARRAPGVSVARTPLNL